MINYFNIIINNFFLGNLNIEKNEINYFYNIFAILKKNHKIVKIIAKMHKIIIYANSEMIKYIIIILANIKIDDLIFCPKIDYFYT